MNAVPFDTLRMAQRLEAAGFSGQQAAGAPEALAEALVGADLATKGDITTVRADIASARTATTAEIAASQAATNAEFAGSRATTTAEFAAVRAEIVNLEAGVMAAIELLRPDMTIKTGGMMIIAVGVIPDRHAHHDHAPVRTHPTEAPSAAPHPA